MNQSDESDMEELGWEEVEVDLAAELPVGDDEGLSLDELDKSTESEAEPYDEAEEHTAVPRSSALSAVGGRDSATHRESDERAVIAPMTILEAMLFVGTPDSRPLFADEIAALMRGVRADEIDELVAELNERYAATGRAFEIVSQGGGYRLQLREELGAVRNRFYGRTKEVRLSQPAVDVLAIVAYRQPITREEVDQLRGKASGGLLNQLVRRNLLEIELSSEKPRRRTYQTTDRFLHMFGIRDLSELPQSLDM